MSKKSIRRPADGVRVAVAQISPVAGDPAANLEKHREAVARASEQGAAVVVFPELSLTGWGSGAALAKLALTRDHEMLLGIAKLSEGGPALVAGFVEETGSHLFFNSAAWFEGGKCVYTQRKSYLRAEPGFDEPRVLAQGKRLRAFDAAVGRTAILSADDVRHPSAVNVVVLDGAETIYVPGACTLRGKVEGDDGDAEARHFEMYLRSMARALCVFIVYANRVGTEAKLAFAGGSTVVGPDGSVLGKASLDQEDVVSVVLPSAAMRSRRLESSIVRDEDIDTTINELERIRERLGRRVVEPAAESRPARERHDEARGRPSDDRAAPPRDRPWNDDRPQRGYERDRPSDRSPRSFDRDRGPDRPPRAFDPDRGPDRPPRSFDRDRGPDRPPRSFDRDRPSDRPYRPHERGGGRDDRGKPRFSRDDDRRPRPRFDRDERGGGPPRAWNKRDQDAAGARSQPQDRRGRSSDEPRTGGFRPKPDEKQAEGRFDPRRGGQAAPGRFRPERGAHRPRPLGRPFPKPGRGRGKDNE